MNTTNIMIIEHLMQVFEQYRIKNGFREVPIHYLDTLYDYLLEELDAGRTQSTITRNSRFVYYYYLSLINNEMVDFEKITAESVITFLNEYEGRARSERGYVLRQYLNYLYDKGLISFTGTYALPKIIKNKRETVVSYYTMNEIKRIVAAIDKSTPMGKRDYLIICLAFELGLRSCDIKNIKYKDIDLTKKCLRVVQRKTGVTLDTSLSDNLIEAIRDYSFNARPETDNDFIIVKKDGNVYSESMKFHKAFNKYIKLAGVETNGRRRGLHTLRHSLASMLFANGTNVKIIADILGQHCDSTVATYVNINFEQIKEIVLEVPFNDEEE